MKSFGCFQTRIPLHVFRVSWSVSSVRRAQNNATQYQEQERAKTTSDRARGYVPENAHFLFSQWSWSRVQELQLPLRRNLFYSKQILPSIVHHPCMVQRPHDSMRIGTDGETTSVWLYASPQATQICCPQGKDSDRINCIYLTNKTKFACYLIVNLTTILLLASDGGLWVGSNQSFSHYFH